MNSIENIKQSFLEILINSKEITDSKTGSKELKNLINLKDYIREEFSYDKNKSNFSYKLIENILSDIDTLDSAIRNYILSIGYELPDDAQTDLENITKLSDNYLNKYSILKDKITYNRYVWHTNPNACLKCQELDNTVYENKFKIPDKPHPNCQCSVEKINEDSKNFEQYKNLNGTIAEINEVNDLNDEIKKVYQYIQDNNKAPHSHITKNIYWDEVVKYPSLSYGKPTIVELTNLYKTAVKIQTFVDIYYPGSTIQINSGWRSKGYNNTLGNAHPNSEHLYGNAIDFKIIGQDINSVYANIESFWKGRHYVHKLYGFIHVDRTKEHGDNVNW